VAVGSRTRLSEARGRLVQPPTLSRSDRERSASWTELFFDLVYVVAVSRITKIVADDPTLHGAAWFVGVMLLVVLSWMNVVVYTERFDTDDVIHRLMKALAMVAVAAVALSAPKAPTSAADELVLSYLALRIVTIMFYLRAYRHVPEVRDGVRVYIIGFGASALLWAVSLVTTDDAASAIRIAAAAIELATPLIAWRRFGEHAFDRGHLSHRFGLFMLIVLGESVVEIVAALEGVTIDAGVLTATTAAAAIVISIWWHNFDFLQRHVPDGGWLVVYEYGALIVFIALAGMSTALGFGIEASESPLPPTMRWMACGALATYLLVPTVIQVGGTRSRMDIATTTRFVAAVTVLMLGSDGRRPRRCHAADARRARGGRTARDRGDGHGSRHA
jgi:low temperature requirement protein LtrA